MNFLKPSLKLLARACARILVFPVFILYRLQLWITGSSECISGYSHFFALLPGLPGMYLRREFYRVALRFCSEKSFIGYGTIFSTADAEIHDGVYIGAYCALGAVIISENSMIASRVSIISGLEQHRRDAAGRLKGNNKERIFIGASCWIGEGAVVAASVGKKCNVAAGAVVLKTLADESAAIGNPARVVKATTQGEI
jgi:virginiamycin A acetyltransferase